MHIITPYDPWTPKKKKTWQEELWEQNQIAELEAQILAEASSRTLPPNSPDISAVVAGPAAGAAGGAGGAPVVHYFNPQVTSIDWTVVPSTTGVAPFAAQFRNLSSQDALSFYTWTWNFNDGDGSNDVHPSHTFYQTGSYRVGLTASFNNVTVTQSVKIVAVSASRPDMPPVVSFTPTQTTGSVPLTFTLTNTTPNYTSTASNIYKWTLSGSVGGNTGLDGILSFPVTTSVATNPTFTLNPSGSYSIKLEATGSWGVTGSTYNILAISASYPSLVAGFGMTRNSTTAPAGARFTNTTTYDGTGTLQATWSYGSASVYLNPVTTSSVGTSAANIFVPSPFNYSAPGNWTASLQVTESSYGVNSRYTQSFTLA